MHFRRAFLATVAAGLALAPAAVADTAFTDLYLARDACGGTEPPNLRLDTGVGAETGGCGNAAAVLGGEPEDYPSNTESHGPLALDATRTAYLAISLTSYTGLLALGDETVDVVLSGKPAEGEIVTIGEASSTKAAADMLRGSAYTAEFEIPIPEDKAGPYEQVTLSLSVGGSAMGGYINHDGTSLVSLPVLDEE
jgi:hypothetical protein